MNTVITNGVARFPSSALMKADTFLRERARDNNRTVSRCYRETHAKRKTPDTIRLLSGISSFPTTLLYQLCSLNIAIRSPSWRPFYNSRRSSTRKNFYDSRFCNRPTRLPYNVWKYSHVLSRTFVLYARGNVKTILRIIVYRTLYVGFQSCTVVKPCTRSFTIDHWNVNYGFWRC